MIRLSKIEAAARSAGMPWDEWVEDDNDYWDPTSEPADAVALAEHHKMVIDFRMEELYYIPGANSQHRYCSWGEGMQAQTWLEAVTLAAADIWEGRG